MDSAGTTTYIHTKDAKVPAMTTPFVPDDFPVPLEFETDLFRLEQLGPQHNERDYAAWMSSIAHIRSTPGYAEGKWPCEVSLEKNRVDLERHVEDFALRRGFTYSVLDGEQIVGAVYVYPAQSAEYDAQVKSWVIAERAELDVVLWKTVSTWLIDAWPFERVHYEPCEDTA